MKELESKIAEKIWIISTETKPSNMTDKDRKLFILYARNILSLIQIEVKCPECINGYVKGISKLGSQQKKKCPTCKGTGKKTKFPESGDKGEIL